MDAHGGAREGDVLSRPSSHAAARVLPSPRSREVRLPRHASHPRFPRPGRRPVPSRAGNAPPESSAPGLDPDGQCLAHRLVEAEVSAAGLIGAAPGLRLGGSVPAALAADWLTTAWDQNAGLFVLSPAAAIVEETVLGWLRELFGLPEGTAWASSPVGRWRTPLAS